jgi:Ulp1 family protease
MGLLKLQDNFLYDAADPKQRKHSCFFSTYFLCQLFIKGVYNYVNVKRWTMTKITRHQKTDDSLFESMYPNGVDVFVMDKLFIPVNIPMTHWMMIVVYMAAKRICYYDSLNGDGMSYLKAIFRWLKDEWRDKNKGGEFVEEGWELLEVKDCPQQENTVRISNRTTSFFFFQ